ncbi:hypothetical protein HJG60_007858 [Phyllostomus discolor]|uniref:Uncharacterized protein n=1 Tax=Phyllostomus discolor TaxID=89673 RepID=A0A834BIE6_9CHIR|nr:hypothetical protein HJG60_007858 [Phyllostomus discolor]
MAQPRTLGGCITVAASRSVSRMPGSDQLLPSWGWHQNDINRQTDGVRKQRRKSPKSWNSGNYLPERGEGREARICKRNINWLPLSRPEGGTKPAAQEARGRRPCALVKNKGRSCAQEPTGPSRQARVAVSLSQNAR